MPTVNQTTSVAILGGGVVGLSLAWELARRGGRVAVFDRDSKVGQASWAGAGILPACGSIGLHHPLDQLRFLSHQLHRQWSLSLKEKTGIDNGYRRCGGIYLAQSRAEKATLAAHVSQWVSEGIEVKRLDRSELLEREPELQSCESAQGELVAYHLPDECQLRNPRHLQALRKACELDGVILVSEEVLDVIPNPNETVTLQMVSKSYRCEQVCICGGAWSETWLSKFGVAPAIYPLRGQMVLYRTKEPLLRQIISEGHRYLVPRDDGRLLIGSSEEEVGFRTGTTPEVLEDLCSWATQRVKGLSTESIEQSWSGFRPATVDGLPYLGRIPGQPQLFVAAGHGRHGLHWSCATAQCMADLMVGIAPPFSMEPFRVSRGSSWITT